MLSSSVARCLISNIEIGLFFLCGKPLVVAPSGSLDDCVFCFHFMGVYQLHPFVNNAKFALMVVIDRWFLDLALAFLVPIATL